MKNIAQHIEELLVKHNCVIVPSLGGFIVYQEESRIEKNKLYAPSSKIGFNQLLSYHDGLLAESYMKERKIGYNEAILLVNEDVAKIKSQIDSGNTYILGKIGALSKTATGNIILRNGNTAFLPNNIGLPTVRLQKLSEKRANSDNTIVLSIPKSSGNAMRYAAMLAAVFLITILFPNSVNDTANMASISFDTIKNIALPDKKPSIEVEDTAVEITYEEEKTKNEPKTVNVETSIKSAKDKYHLIVASLTSREQAEEYIASQDKYECSELQIIECKGKYRISSKSFSSYKKAIAYMDSLKTDSPNAKKAWILCK